MREAGSLIGTTGRLGRAARALSFLTTEFLRELGQYGSFAKRRFGDRHGDGGSNDFNLSQRLTTARLD